MEEGLWINCERYTSKTYNQRISVLTSAFPKTHLEKLREALCYMVSTLYLTFYTLIFGKKITAIKRVKIITYIYPLELEKATEPPTYYPENNPSGM